MPIQTIVQTPWGIVTSVITTSEPNNNCLWRTLDSGLHHALHRVLEQCYHRIGAGIVRALRR